MGRENISPKPQIPSLKSQETSNTENDCFPWSLGLGILKLGLPGCRFLFIIYSLSTACLRPFSIIFVRNEKEPDK
jgi:hypothetical protein